MSLSSLFYFFSASDQAGNWNQTMIKQIEVIDNDPPIFNKDLSDEKGTTGDSYNFSLESEDNIEIDNVTVEYWFGVDNKVHETHIMEGKGLFMHSIILPIDSTDELFYCFHSTDSSGNINTTKIRNITIYDNDKPTIITESINEKIGTGEPLKIIADIEDNIGIEMVEIEYWFSEEYHKTDYIENIDGYYVYIIDIPFNSTKGLYFILKANDVSGLMNQTDRITVTIIDIIPPTIQHVQNISAYVGENISVEVESSDNIKITEYFWENNPVPTEMNKMEGQLTNEGIFNVTIFVYDEERNFAFFNFTVIVLPIDYDSDEDGIPDLIEILLGLDMNSSSDAFLDEDNDGLTNLEEYSNGTNIRTNDTDGDGMPDGWEVSNGLNPLKPSSLNDNDKDGFTDFEEYINGTDPNVVDQQDDTEEEIKDGNHIWIMIIIISLILTILVGIGIFITIKRRSDTNQQIAEGKEKTNLNEITGESNIEE
jgi:heme/copper-type cytochrome/quinol oxidase subunit 2